MRWLVPKRHRTKRRSGINNERADDTRWSSAKFDDSTGQIYLETTATLQMSDDLTWARDCELLRIEDSEREYFGNLKRKEEKRRAKRKALAEQESDSDLEYDRYVETTEQDGGREDPEEEWKHKKSRNSGLKGARSLQDAAIECVLQNISDITLEGIECLPISIVRRLWDAVNRRCSRSFNAWMLFSKVLREDDALPLNLLRYHQTFKSPNCQLEVYTNPLTSVSYDFITSLSITTAVSVPDLVKLSNVTNLGVLEIINADGCENMSVGDRLIRAWHLAALNDGAFSVLRILKLFNHEGLTTKSLSYLNSFPALAIYDVQGCKFDLNAKVEATRLGWKPTLETNILRLLERACAERAALMRTNLDMEATPPQPFCWEHLCHGAKVNRVPRGNIPAFLAQAYTLNKENADLSEMKASATDSEKIKAKSRNRKSRTASEAWDVPIYRAFARIGELRNDTDLVRAGVFVGDQAVVGNELVNSVPMVSLRLGKFPAWLEVNSITDTGKSLNGLKYDFCFKENPKLATSTKRGLAFIRIKIPPAPIPAAKTSSQDSLYASSQNETGSRASSSQTTLPKRQASGIVRNKKRKLDDVLSSFS